MTHSTRAEARAAGATRYFTGKPCVAGHVVERHTTNSTCVRCTAKRVADWGLANRERKTACALASQRRNPERVKASAKASRAKNSEKRAAAMKAWYDANRERMRELNRRWVSENRASLCARQAARLAAKSKATPWWLTDEHRAQIRALYEDAQRLTAETGVKHHVDHIVPVGGETVTGLHVPWNLRVITASENVRKKNKLIPDLALAS